MVANLTPAYEKADKRYREATTDQERLEALQEMLSTIPKHKASEKMQADLKRRISQARKDAAKKGPSRGVVDLFHVPKSGAGQAVLVGMPNVGKSALVAVATNAPVKVADYPFTTTVPAPGMWKFEGVQIQLVDTPPLTAEHFAPGLMGTIRSADIVVVVIDMSTDPLEQTDAVLGLLAERGLTLKSVPQDQLDPLDNAVLPGLIAATKIDRAEAGTLETYRELCGDRLEIIPVSAESGEGLDRLVKRLWELLAEIRVYTKEPGKPADHERPYTLPVGSTLEDLAREIHRDLPELMTYARIWGDGRFEGQRVQKTEVLHDRDVVEIHQ